MDVTTTLHAMVDDVLELPGLKQWRQHKYERRFVNAEQVNLFRGVYPSLEAANAAIPTTKPVGYDNEAPAAMYDERTRQIYPSDYPILFWLQKLLSEQCHRVFDIGGHVGVGYYAYQHLIDYPANLSWRVSDVPAVAERGRQLAQVRDPAAHLSFTSELSEADGADIVFASGSIQYIPPTLAALLSGLSHRPRHLLINLLPLHARETFFTVQNIGTAFCPYRIEAYDRFVNDLIALGYQLRDSWENLEKRCEIPFSPKHYSLDRYHGFYFSLS